jgi:hypothetical protein
VLDQQITAFLLKCLWVIGGFAGGYLLTWLAGVGFDKVVTKGKSPQFLHKWARIVGGVLAAILVAFFVFPQGPGAGGGGGGGGVLPGGESNPTTPETGKPPPTEKLPEVPVEAVAVRVRVFAGEQVEQTPEKTWRYFEVGESPAGKVDVGGVAEAVRQQKGASTGGVVVVYSFDPSASERTEGYRQLKDEAKRLGVPLVSEDEFRQLRKK